MPVRPQSANRELLQLQGADRNSGRLTWEVSSFRFGAGPDSGELAEFGDDPPVGSGMSGPGGT